jgi:hypothetical protein
VVRAQSSRPAEGTPARADGNGRKGGKIDAIHFSGAGS